MHTVPSYSPGEPASSNTPGATSCIISVRCSFPSCYPFSCDNFWGKAKQSALALLDERLLIIFQAVLQGHPIEHPKSTKRTNAAAAKAIIYTCELGEFICQAGARRCWIGSTESKDARMPSRWAHSHVAQWDSILLHASNGGRIRRLA